MNPKTKYFALGQQCLSMKAKQHGMHVIGGSAGKVPA